MKKVFVIFLTLIIGLSMSAQIQNKILGFTLGSTSKTTVYNYLKSNNIKFSKNENGEYWAKKVKFAGEIWESVWFSFYDGKLYNVHFYISEDSKSIQLMDAIYGKIKKSLDNKYSDYYMYNESTNERHYYFDNVTRIIFSYSYFQGVKSLDLMYSNMPIFSRKLASEEGEL